MVKFAAFITAAAATFSLSTAQSNCNNNKYNSLNDYASAKDYCNQRYCNGGTATVITTIGTSTVFIAATPSTIVSTITQNVNGQVTTITKTNTVTAPASTSTVTMARVDTYCKVKNEEGFRQWGQGELTQIRRALPRQNGDYNKRQTTNKASLFEELKKESDSVQEQACKCIRGTAACNNARQTSTRSVVATTTRTDGTKPQTVFTTVTVGSIATITNFATTTVAGSGSATTTLTLSRPKETQCLVGGCKAQQAVVTGNGKFACKYEQQCESSRKIVAQNGLYVIRTTANTLRECRALCDNEGDCLMYQFNGITGACHVHKTPLYDQTNTGELTGTAGWGWGIRVECAWGNRANSLSPPANFADLLKTAQGQGNFVPTQD